MSANTFGSSYSRTSNFASPLIDLSECVNPNHLLVPSLISDPVRSTLDIVLRVYSDWLLRIQWFGASKYTCAWFSMCPVLVPEGDESEFLWELSFNFLIVENYLSKFWLKWELHFQVLKELRMFWLLRITFPSWNSFWTSPWSNSLPRVHWFTLWPSGSFKVDIFDGDFFYG